jgi:hypothetical protein
MGPLGGHREALELGDRIVTASKSDHGSNEQSLEDPHGLLPAVRPGSPVGRTPCRPARTRRAPNQRRCQAPSGLLTAGRG